MAPGTREWVVESRLLNNTLECFFTCNMSYCTLCVVVGQIPSHLALEELRTACLLIWQDILRGLLEKDPDMRMSLAAAMRHPWTTGSGTLKLLHPSGVPLREFKLSKQDRENAMTPNISNVFSSMAGTVRHFKKGEVILTEGELSEGLFLVKVSPRS